MILAVSHGVANALGLPTASVTITHVGGVPVQAAHRRLAQASSIQFNVKSLASDANSVQTLAASIAEAATEVSLVANVQVLIRAGATN